MWDKNITSLDSTYILPCVKQGVEKVMFWECVANNGVGNLKFIVIKTAALGYINPLCYKLLFRGRKLDLYKTLHFQQKI